MCCTHINIVGRTTGTTTDSVVAAAATLNESIFTLLAYHIGLRVLHVYRRLEANCSQQRPVSEWRVYNIECVFVCGRVIVHGVFFNDYYVKKKK